MADSRGYIPDINWIWTPDGSCDFQNWFLGHSDTKFYRKQTKKIYRSFNWVPTNDISHYALQIGDVGDNNFIPLGSSFCFSAKGNDIINKERTAKACGFYSWDAYKQYRKDMEAQRRRLQHLYE
jgi:hypothetical protein